MVWTVDDSQGNESGKIRWELVRYTTGHGLDIGCGAWKAFPHFVGVDNYKDTTLFGTQFKPDIVSDAEKLDVFKDEAFDFVYSSHTLEHLQDTEAVLREWWRVIKPHGYLILYLPHKEFYPNIGTKEANCDHVHDFMPIDIVRVMDKMGGWDLVRNEDRNEGNEYSFFQVYQKLPGNTRMLSYKNKHKKTVGIVRYGGIGDMVQASSILPMLKRQGYHVVFYTTHYGHEVIKHDPNVDEFYIQGKDQVPAEALPYFWANERKKHDRWINLSESVEGAWLAIDGRTDHAWPHHMRQKYRNVNYLEFLHDLAEVPHRFEQAFYPTSEERVWAKEKADEIGGRIVVWSLSGSSPHKSWPYTDVIIARLMMTYPDVKVVLMGDQICQLLEAGWVKEPRVILTSGKWKVRESLAFLEQASLIIGPETGILNAAGMLDQPKVCFLSHSSPENLTKHWKNTKALQPDNVKCHPCHMLHNTFEHCWQEEKSGAAMCQVQIGPDQAWEAIRIFLGTQQKELA